MARVEMPNSRARSAMAKRSRFSPSRRFTRLPLHRLILLAQLLLAELADERFRQLVLEDDLARHFKLVESFADEFAQLGVGDAGARLELDEGDGHLAAIVIGKTDDVRLVPGRIGGQSLLDRAGIDVEAGRNDEVLDPVHKEHVAIAVDVADIAGTQPTIHERTLGGVVVLVIA